MALTQQGLYRPEFERDNCGFGLIAQIDDQPSHWLVQTAISALARLTHRGAVAADGKSGDGCGLLMKKPDAFLRAVAQENGFALTSNTRSAMSSCHATKRQRPPRASSSQTHSPPTA